jgi:alkylhydroperoxidase AhpD family core domain
METRFHPRNHAPALLEPMLALRNLLNNGSLDASLIHLIDLRASQINGCHFCVKRHTDEARHDGEAADRLEQLSTWATSGAFTPDERAALAWTEALTYGAPSDVIDRLHHQLRAHFNVTQVCEITLCVAAINAWNRLGIAAYRESSDASVAAA